MSAKSLSKMRRYCNRMSDVYSRLGREHLAQAYDAQAQLIGRELSKREDDLLAQLLASRGR